jgi:hypothetical protein
MLTINRAEVANAGGLLSALADRSASYLASTGTNARNRPPRQPVLRHIVHTDPHLDEYFAELLFSSYIAGSQRVEFLEQAIYSENGDLGALQLWPGSVVFGIGRTISTQAKPVFLFDEHLPGHGKSRLSCSDVVRQFVQGGGVGLAPSVQLLTREVNAIDGYGHADPQHLGNLLKALHNVRFVFKKGASAVDDIRDYLDPEWKRALSNACIAAVAFCLDNQIDLVGDPGAKKKSLQATLKHYMKLSPHRDAVEFDEVAQTMASNYGNQAGVFDQAVLKDAGGRPLLDRGSPIPQLLLLSRICFALGHCWGEVIQQLLMMHFWEVEFQQQLSFLRVRKTLEAVFDGTRSIESRTALGVFRGRSVGSFEINIAAAQGRGNVPPRKIKRPLWTINISPGIGVLGAHKAAMNFINRNNHELGIVLIEDGYLGTKTIFRGKAFPPRAWTSFVKHIQSVEPGCWYDPSQDQAKPAFFINNGNRAHQYVRRSAVDIEALSDMASTALNGGFA